MTKPGLLLLSEGTQRFLGGALDDRFDVIHLWQADDRATLLAARGAEVVATLTMDLDAATLARLPNLRLIVAPGAGTDGIDRAAARARNIPVTNAGDTHSADVAEHAVVLALAALHRIPALDAWVRDGRWAAGAPERRHAVSAQRFGIVGLGNIGTAIATRLAPFGAAIAWWGPRPKPAPWPRHDSLADLARWCSVLIVATRGDAAGLIDAATLAAVGPDGLVVNISRGSVIDEDALIDALKAGRLGGAALDVFVDEPTPPARWRDVPNTLLSPHVAGVNHESMARLRDVAVRNLTTVLDGGPLVNVVES